MTDAGAVRELVELLLVVDPVYDQNCYVLHRRDTGSALVIDPGLQHAHTLRLLEQRALRCERILLTHGHPDHVSGVPALKSEHGCSAAMHPDDTEQLAALHLLPGIPADTPDVVIDEELHEGQFLQWHGVGVEVMHTPGHTRGSVCFRIATDLLAGDTLFRRGVGRSDLPGGSPAALLVSIQDRLYTLPPDTVVYPGHGPRTTIAEEMRQNPFVVHPRYR